MLIEVRVINRSRLQLILRVVHCVFDTDGISYQSDSMRRELDVCERICNKKLLHFSYYCECGVLFLVITEQALLMGPKGRNASRDGLVKLWEGAFYYLQYYQFVK